MMKTTKQYHRPLNCEPILATQTNNTTLNLGINIKILSFRALKKQR